MAAKMGVQRFNPPVTAASPWALRLNMNNVADDGRVSSLDTTNSNYPVNSEQSIINNNESVAEYGNQSGAGQNINPY